jgi:sporulation protein YlmC with PRC-barrel domain
MLDRKSIVTMTTAAALCAMPVLAFGQATSGGSSQAPQATQTAPSAGAPGTANTRDGTPGNPPSTATQRALDSATGNRTDADGTGNNPPGTAAGRALDRATGGTAPTATAPGSTAPTATAPATGNSATGATTPGMSVDSVRLRDGRRASQVIGSTVYNENNESVGEVDDLIVPQAGGQPVAILSVGGFLGIGARLVAVPYERLQHNADRNRWMLQGASKDSLQSLPAFTYDNNNRRG